MKTTFRSFSRAAGTVQAFFGIFWAYQWLQAGFAGSVSIGWAMLLAIICLGLVSGGGLLLMFMDPHKVIQTGSMNIFQLVKPFRVQRKSFADRIGVEDDDD